jgi:hypothetical protein
VSDIYIRSSADLYGLVDVFNQASNDVFNAQQMFYDARPSGDPFGNGGADSTYGDACNQMLQGLQNLQNALDALGSRINQIGVMYERVEKGNTNVVDSGGPH